MTEDWAAPAPQPGDEVLTRKQLAAWLHVSPRYVSEDMHRAIPPVPHFHIGRGYRYSKQQIMAWLYELQQQVDTVCINIAHARKQLGKGN